MSSKQNASYHPLNNNQPSPLLISSVRRWFEEEAGVDGYESLDNYKENNDDLYDGFLAEELLDNHNTSLNYESDQGVNLMKWYLMLM